MPAGCGEQVTAVGEAVAVHDPRDDGDVDGRQAESTTAVIRARASRPGAICRLQLDDLDIGNRRLVVDGRIRTLNKLTLQAAPDWLKHRRRRRPTTANPHLLINKHTALETGLISGVSVSARSAARQTHIDEKTPTREAGSARVLLGEAAERPSQ
ncbi:hypothetical protein [Streptomyces mirabilis]|uniref:hypothetical protein n=1 Tax=Streptomyces mirabilis TaxID=68239 RepID=UPI0036F10A44